MNILTSLPVDILRELALLLDGRHLIKLWCTGDSCLQGHLTLPTVVRNFHISFDHNLRKWPSGVRFFPHLHSFRTQASEDSIFLLVNGVNLADIPSTVTSISLCPALCFYGTEPFFGDTQAWKRDVNFTMEPLGSIEPSSRDAAWIRKPFDFKSHFPHLERLDIHSIMDPDERSHLDPWLEFLPSTITSLQLSSNWILTEPGICRLPPSLTSLNCPFRASLIPEKSPGHPFPLPLISIEVMTLGSTWIFSRLSLSSLTSLSILVGADDASFLFTLIHCHALTRLKVVAEDIPSPDVTEKFWKVLPKTLTDLDLEAHFFNETKVSGLQKDAFSLLPRSMKRLRLKFSTHRVASLSVIAELSGGEVSVIQHLPPSLEFLDINLDDSRYREEIELYPKSLKYVYGGLFTKWRHPSCHLPPSIVVPLRFMFASAEDLIESPISITDLDLGLLDIAEEVKSLLAQKFRQWPLRLFKCGRKVTTDLIAILPDTVTSLKLELLDGVVKKWPESLTSLEAWDVRASLLYHLPPTLRSLTLVHTFDLSPEVLNSLPPRIEELNVYKFERLEDSHIPTLPRTLRRFRTSECSVSPEGLKHLPTTLTDLQLYNSNSCPEDQDQILQVLESTLPHLRTADTSAPRHQTASFQARRLEAAIIGVKRETSSQMGWFGCQDSWNLHESPPNLGSLPSV